MFHEPWTITPPFRPGTRPTPTVPPGETGALEEPEAQACLLEEESQGPQQAKPSLKTLKTRARLGS